MRAGAEGIDRFGGREGPRQRFGLRKGRAVAGRRNVFAGLADDCVT